MSFSDIFHPECDPEEPADAPDHAMFSCLQWKTPSLSVMPQAGKQCFAIVWRPRKSYNPACSPNVGASVNIRRHTAGQTGRHTRGLSVPLPGAGVSSTTFQEIESQWIQVMCMSNTRLTVDFASVNKAYSGLFGYLFWQDAKEILQFYSLGIEQYELKLPVDPSDEDLTNKAQRPNHSQGINAKPEAIKATLMKRQYFADWENFCDFLNINNCNHARTLLYCRKPDVQ
ncbi:hypothetical protein [Pseudomonas moraviensis]|jgi:hypothetical protein|nr:hypothetical protein [Pseudomonas moraviensis]